MYRILRLSIILSWVMILQGSCGAFGMVLIDDVEQLEKYRHLHLMILIVGVFGMIILTIIYERLKKQLKKNKIT